MLNVKQFNYFITYFKNFIYLSKITKAKINRAQYSGLIKFCTINTHTHIKKNKSKTKLIICL